MRQAIALDRITVGTGFDGSECLHVWPTEERARQAIADSPMGDSQMMSTTTYHRSATGEDVLRLIYDHEGNEIVLDLPDLIDAHASAAALGRKGGSVKSERKTAAVRENAKKGGRPTNYKKKEGK